MLLCCARADEAGGGKESAAKSSGPSKKIVRNRARLLNNGNGMQYQPRIVDSADARQQLRKRVASDPSYGIDVTEQYIGV